MYPDVSLDTYSLIHMYWSCPSLGKYWREVLYTLSIALNFNLAPDPLIALSGITGKEDSHLTPNKRRSLSFAFLLARRAVLLRWKDAVPPTHSIAGGHYVLSEPGENPLPSP